MKSAGVGSALHFLGGLAKQKLLSVLLWKTKSKLGFTRFQIIKSGTEEEEGVIEGDRSKEEGMCVRPNPFYSDPFCFL